ncbi:hypothetical protein MMC13_004537 [Lambiella insularis]|nr:hypothetical protein [Lambiella insularis]
MAFTINSILNEKDVSPVRSKRPVHPFRGAAITQGQVPGTPNIVTKTASFGVVPTVTLSPERGNLYLRRTSRSPQHHQNNDRLIPIAPAKSDASSNYDSDAPPSHEYDFNGFNIFKAFFGHPEIMHEFTKALDIDDLVSLYAISKDFFTFCNRRFTALILGQATTRASESAEIFKWKCYKNLCQLDPAMRKNEEIKLNAEAVKQIEEQGKIVPESIRNVPSFRWLRMVLHREKVVDGILTCLSVEGIRVPKRTTLTLKKIWLTMDIPDNARRIGLIHNKKFWTDKDLYLATMFLIKLDMRLSDPVDSLGERGIRRMLMAQPNLDILYRALKRELLCNQFDLMRMFVQWKWRPQPQHAGMEICGVHPDDVGALQREGYGQGKKLLIAPDDLIMRECVRRSLNLHRFYVDMMLWGNINPKTFENIMPGQSAEKEEEDEWSDSDSSDSEKSEDEDVMNPDGFDLIG